MEGKHYHHLRLTIHSSIWPWYPLRSRMDRFWCLKSCSGRVIFPSRCSIKFFFQLALRWQSLASPWNCQFERIQSLGLREGLRQKSGESLRIDSYVKNVLCSRTLVFCRGQCFIVVLLISDTFFFSFPSLKGSVLCNVAVLCVDCVSCSVWV